MRLARACVGVGALSAPHRKCVCVHGDALGESVCVRGGSLAGGVGGGGGCGDGAKWRGAVSTTDLSPEEGYGHEHHIPLDQEHQLPLEHQQLEGGDTRPVEGDDDQLEGWDVRPVSPFSHGGDMRLVTVSALLLVCRDSVERVPRGCKF